MPDRQLALEVFEPPGTRSYLYHLWLDAHPIAANQALSRERSEEAREIEEAYNGLFAELTPPRLASAQMQAIGTQLFEVWLRAHWEEVQRLLGVDDRYILRVSSARPEILNLPWELLRVPGGEDIGTKLNWGVRRFPWSDRQPGAASALRPGPLRVLFAACSPRDLPELDFEREEELLSRAITPSAFLETSDFGTFDELEDHINSFHPHIVHLSGHGMIDEHGAAFVFEDEKGNSDPRSARRLGEVFAGSGVQCAFVSGCVAGRAPPRKVLGGLCQNIVANGVPLAIGWGASIVDDVATRIAEAFYKSVARGQPVDRALAAARGSAKWTPELRDNPSWSLPVLFAAGTDARVYDENLPSSGWPEAALDQEPLPGMVGGHARQFVGRRRELQKILPSLRTGELQGLVITGMAGAGKSCLATRLARKLMARKPTAGAGRPAPIVLSSESGVPLSPEKLLKAFGDAFLATRQRNAHDLTADTNISVESRLRSLVSTLNAESYVLVLDNFENSLDEGTRTILDPLVAGFFKHLLENLVGSSRVIVTSRYPPAYANLPATIALLSLGEFPETQYLKFLFRDREVKKRYQRVGFEDELLTHLHRLFGASPGFLMRLRRELKTIEAEHLLDGVRQRTRFAGQVTDGPLHLLEQKQKEYCSAMALDRLFGRLSDASRRMLSRACVYPGPMTLEALAAVTGASQNDVRRELGGWQKAALAYAEPEAAGLWSIYGTLRGWLCAGERLPPEERSAAHRAAADYLLAMQEQHREKELLLTRGSCLSLAYSQYVSAGAMAEARDAVDKLSELLIRQGEYAKVQRLNDEHLELEEHPDTMTWIARSYVERGEYSKARHWYDRALKSAGDRLPKQAAQAKQGLATVNIRTGQPSLARALLEQALAIQLSIGDRLGQGLTTHQLASIDFNEGRHADAQAGFEKTLSLLEGLSEAEELVQGSLHQLGSIDLEENSLPEARKALEKALALARSLTDRKAEADALHQLGRIEAKEGSVQRAIETLREALGMRRSIGDRVGEAKSFHRLGELAADLGHLETAFRLQAVRYVIHRTLGHGSGDHDLEDLKKQAQQLGYTPEALDHRLKEVEQEYLRNGAKALLKQFFSSVA
jgi:tetratricopeptide (TPR) repeat protein